MQVSCCGVNLLISWQDYSLFQRYRRQIHGQQHAGFGKFVHADDRPRGAVVAHFADISPVHFFEVAHVLEKDIDVNDMAQVGVVRRQHHFERVQDLGGLRKDIPACQLTGFGIHTRSPADGDEPADFGNVVIGSDRRGSVGRGGCFNDGRHFSPD